ncbi:MAG: phytanoyl-CoA dioxygenase family protein [Alphaproteobacteria bacterium]|nr:phytanoyl-CoA dioxygenase family protein [Alphaproteobacteria bacterium]
MPKQLSQAQIDAYHHDGYLSPFTLFSEEEASAIRRELEAAEARWPEAFEGAGRNNAHLNLTFLDETVHYPRLIDAVEDLIGPNILAYGSVLFIKEPQDVGYVSWHQDCRYMGLEPHDSAVCAWIALTPSNSTNGCMSMIPGSHKHGVAEHADTFGEDNILTRGQTIEGVDESMAVDLILEPGQMSFHHMRTVHGSKPNRSSDRRIGFTIQPYMMPEMRQVISPTMAQLVRGTDARGHFEIAPRPERSMDSDSVAQRDRNNAQWAEILYEGADHRRNL